MDKYIVEFIGTFGLVAAVAFTGNPALIAGIFAIAVGIGKGHYNPAITFWSYFAGKLTDYDTAMYIASQISASALVIALKNGSS